MPASPRTRLEQRAQAAHLTVREFADRYRQVASEIGVKASVGHRTVERWLAGGITVPGSAMCRVLEHWFGEPIEVLLGVPAVAQPRLVMTVDPARLLRTAGRESTDHALRAAAALDPAALESLHAETARLCRAYLTTPSLQLLRELARLRDTVQVQLDRTRKPRQQADLYLLAGQICGLLSSVAFDIGLPESAEELARVAHTYGSVIDHPSLCAWARALTMSVLLWSGEYRRVITVGDETERQAPAGIPRARVYAVRARAWAHLGAVDRRAADLADSRTELDRSAEDELVDRDGGELGFGEARRALCAATAYVSLRDGHRGELEAQAALDAFTDGPAHSRWPAGELSARTDLATARALAGDLAGAEAALGPVLRLPAEHRTEAVVRRMTNLGRLVTAHRYHGAAEAVRIQQAVNEFTAHALPTTTTSIDLPSAPAGYRADR